MANRGGTVDDATDEHSTIRNNANILRADERREQLRLLGLFTPALMLNALFLFVPIACLFGLSFVGADGSLSLENYARLIAYRSYAVVFETTFEMSLVISIACLLLGYPLAYLLAEMPQRWANVLMIGVLLPYWTSILVRTYAWLVILQRKGLINNALVALGLIDEPLALAHNFFGTAIGMIHIMLPFLVLPLYASMKAINRDLIRAAANLGAAPIAVFWRVYLPLSLPGLFAGLLLVFVLCLGFYVTPAALGGGKVIMIAQSIENNISLYSNWGAASALGLVLLTLTSSILFLVGRLPPLRRFDTGI